MSTDTKNTPSSTTTTNDDENASFLTKLKETTLLALKKYHSLARINLAQKLILPHLPSIVRPHIESLTNHIKTHTSTKLPSLSSSITEEDVILVGLLLHTLPTLFLLIRHTNILPFTVEVFATLLYPLKKTVTAIEQRRHDTSGHLLSFWVLLSSMHVLDNLFGLRYYFPRSYLPLKCLISYYMVNSKRQWIMVWDAVVTYVYVLPKLGLSDGRAHRADLMKKEMEEKDAALEKKIEATNSGDDAAAKEDKTRDNSPASDAASEFSYVDLAELAELVSVTLTVKDMTAEKLMIFEPKEKDAESPYLVFDIVDSKDVGHSENGKGKKYKTLEGALVEDEVEEEEEVKEPELVAEEEEEKAEGEEAKETAAAEDTETTDESKEGETEKNDGDDKKEETTDTTAAPTAESPKIEPEKKKSTSFTWEGQVISIPTKIRSSATGTADKKKEETDEKDGQTEEKTATTSPEDSTSSYLRIMAYEKCAIGNDAFVGMSHLDIADLALIEEEKAYQVLLKNDKVLSENAKSGEVSMSVTCARK